MASGRDSPNLSTVVSGLHLIFTLTSVAFFTYKLYYLENELSLIRREVPESQLSLKQLHLTWFKAAKSKEVDGTAEPERGNPKRHQQPTSSKQYVFRNCSTMFRFVTYLCFKHLTETAKENLNRERRFIDCWTSPLI